MTQAFNASQYLLDRQVAAGHQDRLALTGPAGDLTYGALSQLVQRAAGGLRRLGLRREQRLVLFMADTPELVVLYLAAMRIGAVPVPVSTMLRDDGLAELLRDSRATMLAVTSDYAATASSAAAAAPELELILAGPDTVIDGGPAVVGTAELVAGPPDDFVDPTTADSPAFWLYTSGTTGSPKGAVHRHAAIRAVCETYGSAVLRITPQDRCLSAAKAFFAYGLGNSVLFPLSVGAATILEPSPSRPDAIARLASEYGATLFFAGPTFFAGMLRAELPPDCLRGVRLAASAGEPLPAALNRRWRERFSVEVLDGLGMTEMLHIFLSNQPGAARPGTSGTAVPGYDLRLVDELGAEVPDDTPGTLLVRGESAACGYWARYDATRRVFEGEWLRTGDTYTRGADGYYTCLGRSSDMLKASGMWVAPTEVEECLLAHEAVAQAVVVAALDADALEKPVAFVVCHPHQEAGEDELIGWCRERLPSFKRPRRVVFVDGYPVTATGKVRRVDLRREAAALLAPAERPPGP